MYDDDIDWISASGDFGLISLCREMESLAAPLQSLVGARATNATKARRRIRRASPAGLEALAAPY